MFLFISSWSHTQARMVMRRLGGSSSLVDPHAVCYGDRRFELCNDGNGTRVGFGRRTFVPEALFWNVRPRADAAMPPRSVRYVAAYRSRLKQLFDDLSYALPDSIQLPGPLHLIERCESKPWLMSVARPLGLDVPSYTVDVASGGAPIKPAASGGTYRKVLGPPHIVTESGLGVTTTNVLVRTRRERLVGQRNPWQYQEPIDFVAQWRFQVVGKNVWASRWAHAPSGREWDLRYHQEILGERPRFVTTSPDRDVAQRLAKLVRVCGLSHAAPEALETKDGRMVLIDLNPCGDWRGFFGRDAENEIAEAMARAVTAIAQRGSSSR